MPRAALLPRIDANASRRRESSFADKVAIGARFFLVLDDQIGEFADRARAEADEDGGVILGKSLKIAVHPPLARRDRKRIIGTREMVEADRNIAGVGQASIRSEEHTSELQSLMRISYAVFCLKKKIENPLPHCRHIQYLHK